MIFRRWRERRRNLPSPDELLPPEGVALTLPIAGVGVRLGAQITDIIITLVAAICVVVLLLALDITGPQTIFVIGTLIFFLIRTPYYVLAELAWNGQTLGKRLMKIKVVSHDGGSLSAHAIVLRNLMKEAEVFLPATLLLTLDSASPIASILSLGWITVGLLVPIMDRYRRRLGDMMAGTHVIHLPVPLLLKDLASEAPAYGEKKQKFKFLTHQLDHYGAFELQTLETLLRSQSNPQSSSAAKQRDATIEAIVERIRKKIGYADPVPHADRVRFLKAFYNAQREHLEQRQLFGDRRENKHYAQSGEET
ncbi:MAG: RDD family protein [Roseibium sp.]|uniref:RDD family protein n=1 Tax=Roseibium sp. TaxID=1936156 RepID=UPI001B2659C2|nr:RDD family protein [Roseibium sp.]MBO6892191.1 RDD family protein [Roseibium sp.]MBO6931026.1 RDD family protein [Roseibium sp.]